MTGAEPQRRSGDALARTPAGSGSTVLAQSTKHKQPAPNLAKPWKQTPAAPHFNPQHSAQPQNYDAGVDNQANSMEYAAIARGQAAASAAAGDAPGKVPTHGSDAADSPQATKQDRAGTPELTVMPTPQPDDAVANDGVRRAGCDGGAALRNEGHAAPAAAGSEETGSIAVDVMEHVKKLEAVRAAVCPTAWCECQIKRRALLPKLLAVMERGCGPECADADGGTEDAG